MDCRLPKKPLVEWAAAVLPHWTLRFLSQDSANHCEPEQAWRLQSLELSLQDDLFLLAVEADALGDDLKWEISRNDALFPHLYRKLQLADVVWAQPLPLMEGVHQFPPGFEEAGA